MKWWGWGDPDIAFPIEDKPALWPFIRDRLGIDHEGFSPPPPRAGLTLPPAKADSAFSVALAARFDPARFSHADDDRLARAAGKSYPNLLQARSGAFCSLPDVILLPTTQAEVEAMIALAHEHHVCLIPFGGGTNIVGGVDPPEADRRIVATLDMRGLDRLVTLDPLSRTAEIEAGATGPKLEADLNARGFSLGHFPDSFEYSTLGGWLATRSAGMQSDAYGRIEDMVVSVTVITPSGTITTRPVPASGAGPDLNRVIVGSEGTLGVITKAVMRVHPLPEAKHYVGMLFRSFEDGVGAIRDCIEAGLRPSMIRLQDAEETALAMHMRSSGGGLSAWVAVALKSYLRRTGYGAPCLMVVGFEGTRDHVRTLRARTLRRLKRHGGFNLGRSIGNTWSRSKYDMPYLRDFVMDRQIMCDVAETSATWQDLPTLYRQVVAAMSSKFATEGEKGFIGCHISHTYETGACLYFTFAVRQSPGEELEQYRGYKTLITDTIVAAGGALTHHHAIGTEHLPWFRNEITETGMQALLALKDALDPRGVMNGGKLLVRGPDEPRSLREALAETACPPLKRLEYD